MFIEPSWQESIVALLVAINALSGAADRTAPHRSFAPDDVVTIALSLQDRSYRPERWFTHGAGIQKPIPQSAPAISAAEQYALIARAVEPAGLRLMSKKSGGFLYEDPFYALLASYNIGIAGSGLLEISVSSRNQAWAQRQRIVTELQQGTYRPERYFAATGPALAAEEGGPMGLVSLLGADLSRLAENGMTEVRPDGKPARLYGLYHYVAP